MHRLEEATLDRSSRVVTGCGYVLAGTVIRVGLELAEDN
jgi:hypothetical protein